MNFRKISEVDGQKTYVIVLDTNEEAYSALATFATGDDGKASLHLHAVLGLKDGSTRRGHFLDGTVHSTLEATIVEAPSHLRRSHQKDLGIALIDI
ncbi:DUF296 domain-containing protein [Rhizobium lusitanum]|uniref:DUF296 domain-containing protein n=1 Tax=Rhizobium lusitanum TaxID=293958 RepID=A0A6L9UFG1_9HYPH|nr:DUF296 domain-containing protein [Rhizobium lusitanum]NEI72906.1 DUF296 domain-containing protein [Rhizobium lusitanum]